MDLNPTYDRSSRTSCPLLDALLSRASILVFYLVAALGSFIRHTSQSLRGVACV